MMIAFCLLREDVRLITCACSAVWVNSSANRCRAGRCSACGGGAADAPLMEQSDLLRTPFFYEVGWIKKGLRGKLPIPTVSDVLQSLDVCQVYPTAKHLHCSQVLQLAEGPGNSHPVRPDHGAQMLVGVVGGYLDLLACSHLPFALAQH